MKTVMITKPAIAINNNYVLETFRFLIVLKTFYYSS